MGGERRRESTPGRGHRRLEAAAVVVAAAAGSALAWEVATAPGSASPWLLLAGLLLAHPAADLVSGLVHFAADRLLSEDVPWLGPRFVRPFREHHVDPGGIVSHDFVETNGNTCIALLPFLVAVAALLDPTAGNPAAGFLQSFAVGLAVWLCITNQFHKWAHAYRSPPAIRWLQRHHLALAPAHHAVHHRPPFDRRFCITSGWWNRPLDALGWLARSRGPSPGEPRGRLAASRTLAHAGRDEARGDREGRQHPAGHRRPAR
jgi:hypothetical protein